MVLPAEKSVLILSSNSDFSLTRPEVILCRFIRKYGLVPVLICPKEGSLSRILREEGISVSILPNIHRWRSFRTRLRAPWMLRFILRIASERDVALVHAGRLSVTPFAVKAARRLGVPCLTHLHGIPRDAGKFRRYLLQQADALIAVSNAVLTYCPAEIRQKAQVIYNGMDIVDFRSRAAESNVRADFGISPHDPIIGMVGPFYRKGADIFIQAAGIVKQDFPSARFLFLGDFRERQMQAQLTTLITSLELQQAVIFAGMQLNIAPFMAASDIWIVPSRHDAAPMVAQEAMALGKPVIGSRVGGIPELVENEITGFIVPPEDPQALAEAICKLLRNPQLRHIFGEAGRKKVGKEYSLEGFYERMSEVYRDLLETKSA